MVDFLYMSKAPFVADSGGRPRVFRKELIKVGTWFDGKRKWTVDEPLLMHWLKTFDEWTRDGHRVTMPVEHTEDPEKNRGYVIGMSVDLNDSGELALFGDCEFAAGYESLANTTDVSVYSPGEVVQGTGKRYVRPVKHVALTNNPVVSGLGKFQPIAASLLGAVSMPKLRDVAAKFGLTPKDDATDDAILASLMEVDTAFSMRSLAKKLGVEHGDGDDDKAIEAAIASAFKKRAPPKEKPKDVSAAMVDLVRDNREMKLSSLLAEGKITKAVHAKMVQQYADKEAIAASLADGAQDGFDQMFSLLKANEPVLSFRQQSGPQNPMAMSNPLDPAQNPLVADAERRAKEAREAPVRTR